MEDEESVLRDEEKDLRDKIKQGLSENNSDIEIISDHFNSISKETKELIPLEIWESVNRGVTWFLAINIGTLLWILSNFDKFKLPDVQPISMPNKEIYFLSILFVGSSSLLMSIIQGMLYWSQYNVNRKYNKYINYMNLCRKNFAVIKDDINEMIEKSDSIPTRDLCYKFKKLGKNIKELKQDLINSDTLHSQFLESLNIMSVFSYCEFWMVPPIAFYILGISLISIYIYLFMHTYIT